jgi:hypothetical protein
MEARMTNIIEQANPKSREYARHVQRFLAYAEKASPKAENVPAILQPPGFCADSMRQSI